MALTVPLLVMYEVELISFVDHDAANTYASFTKVSAPLKLSKVYVLLFFGVQPMATGGETAGISTSASGGRQS